MPADARARRSFARLSRPWRSRAVVVAPYAVRVCAQSRDARRTTRSRRPAVFGDRANYLATTAGERDSRRVERAVRTTGAPAVPRRDRGRARGDRARWRSIDGASRCSSIGVIGFVISLGLNSPFYEPLRAVFFPYRGLRAPARAIDPRVSSRWRRWPRMAGRALMRGRSQVGHDDRDRRRWRRRCSSNIAHASTRGSPFPAAAEVYRWLATQPRSVVAEVPFARADRLAQHLPTASTCSAARGTGSRSSTATAVSFRRRSWSSPSTRRRFPDERSIEYLKQRGVDLLVIHGSLLSPEEFGEMTAALLARPDIEAMASLKSGWVRTWCFACCSEVVPSTARRVPRPNTAAGRAMEPLAPNSR